MRPGDRYPTNNSGILEIVSYTDNRNVDIVFPATGYRMTAQKDNILRGAVRDKLMPRVSGVGYIGVGPHQHRIGGKLVRCYTVWKGMLQRCYSERHQKLYPAYVGCSVCKEWHNWQNFATWYYANLPEDADTVLYELDKDMKVPGNKVYSPDTCTFLTKAQNIDLTHAGEWVFKSPEGVKVHIRNLSKFCKENGLDTSNMAGVHCGRKRICKGWTRYEEIQPEVPSGEF